MNVIPDPVRDPWTSKWILNFITMTSRARRHFPSCDAIATTADWPERLLHA